MTEVDRDQLRRLLLRWQGGELHAIEVLEEAETLSEHLGPLPQYLHSDPRSIATEVLYDLDILIAQRITSDDISALLAFLDTPTGAEAQGWQDIQRYWEGIDFDRRP